MSDTIDVRLLGEQVKRLLSEYADFRDQLTVLTAICMRVESAGNSFAIQIGAMHSRQDRLSARVSDIEQKIDRMDAKLDRILGKLEA